MQVVSVQLGEAPGRLRVQTRKRRVLHRERIARRALPHSRSVISRLVGPDLHYALYPGHGADINRRRPVRSFDPPAERFGRDLREQALHERDGAQALVVAQVQFTEVPFHTAPEFVLLAGVSRADMPRQLLQVVHHRALVARLVGRGVAAPLLNEPTCRSQMACVSLPARKAGLEEPRPYGIAHAQLCGVERADGRFGHVPCVRAHLHHKVIRHRADAGRLGGGDAADPSVEPVVSDIGLDDAATGLRRAVHRMGGEKGQQVRAAHRSRVRRDCETKPCTGPIEISMRVVTI